MRFVFKGIKWLVENIFGGSGLVLLAQNRPVVSHSKICDIRFWIIRKSLLPGKLRKSPILFPSCINLQQRPLFREFDRFKFCSRSPSGGQILHCGTISCFTAFACYRLLRVQCLEYFTVVIEGAGQKRKRVVLKTAAKTGICN
jgi:hypothetical protein